MKKEVTIFCLIFLVLFFSSSLKADFEIGNLSHSIDGQYGPGEDVRGWINISLNDEVVDSVFQDSFDNTISLIDLIKKSTNSYFEYNCTPKNCAVDYLASNSQTEKTFNLSKGKSKIVGLKLDGNIESIDSIGFFLTSDAPPSCYNQFEIDILNDGVIDVKNNKSSNSTCTSSKNYGCFDLNKSAYEVVIGENPYCQKIKLSEAPGFRLGAWVKEETAGTKVLTMSLYDGSENKASCTLPDADSSGSEISCNVDYLVKESKYYYVCISSNSGTGTYKTKGYSGTTNCGFQGYPIQSETNAYMIFSEPKMFDTVGTFNVLNSLQTGENFGAIVKNYIDDKYGVSGCPSEGCIIPINITSKISQRITINNLQIVYNVVGLSGITETHFYDMNETSAKINSSGFQALYLDEGGFSLPTSKGNKTFELALNDETLFSETVSIVDVPVIKSLSPRTTASAFPTTFEVYTDSSNISEYKWDFGDNSSAETTENKIIHTYSSTGEYKLKITITDLYQKSSSRIFNITVNTPEKEINETLVKKIGYLANINSQINEFPIFYKESLKSVLQPEVINDDLKKLQRDFASASTEEEYNNIMTELVNLKVPQSIVTTKSTTPVLFFPMKNNVDLNVLKQIGGGDYESGKENLYVDSILAWQQENLETKIGFKEFSGFYDYSVEPILEVFELTINEKNALDYNPYLILRKLDDLKFRDSYGEKEESGYIYMKLISSPQTIAFSTTGNVDFVSLPLFIAPELNRLTLISEEVGGEGEKKSFKWTIFLLVLCLLIILAFAIYIVLQEWYKRKYEKYLFKERNNLYNLINYVQEMKNRGLNNEEIIKRLKKVGWNSEQIRYVMKKYAGEKTGMFEIPIGKILDRLRNKKTEFKTGTK